MIDKPAKPLTRKEREAIEAVLRFDGAKGAAHALGVSVGTIKSRLYYARIRQRLQTMDQVYYWLDRAA